MPGRGSVLGSNNWGSSFFWEHPCLGEEAGQLSLPFVGKKSQIEHPSSTTGEHEINSPRGKKQDRVPHPCPVALLRATGSHRICFLLLSGPSKFMLQPLEPGSAGFASSLERCLSEKACGSQKNALWK